MAKKSRVRAEGAKRSPIAGTESAKKETTADKNVPTLSVGVWQLATLLITIAFLALLAYVVTTPASQASSSQSNGSQGDATQHAPPMSQVADDVVKFLNDYLLQGKGTAVLENVAEKSGVYMLNFSVSGQTNTVYVSKDGNLLFLWSIDINKAKQTPPTQGEEQNQDQTQQNIPKSDRPVVELFVMSYCPYGLQMEKGILPVLSLLKDKIDYSIRFVNYAMHGEKEVYENLRQYCIQRELPEKYLDYLSCFLDNGDYEECMNKAGVSESDIATCENETDTEYNITGILEDPEKTEWFSGRFPAFKIDDAKNQEYGVRGSPTLVINGKVVTSARDAVSLLSTICSAFNTEPGECNTDLSSYGSPSPGFGFTQGGSGGASGGCEA